MTIGTLMLLLAGVGLVAVVALLIYHLSAYHSRPRARVRVDGVQEMEVVVEAGYHPETVVVQQGRPTRLNFVRRESGECSDWVIFPDLGLVKKLEPFHTTPVEFTPKQSGEFAFTCKFKVCRGRLIVERQTNRGEPSSEKPVHSL